MVTDGMRLSGDCDAGVDEEGGKNPPGTERARLLRRACVEDKSIMAEMGKPWGRPGI